MIELYANSSCVDLIFNINEVVLSKMRKTHTQPICENKLKTKNEQDFINGQIDAETKSHFYSLANDAERRFKLSS